MINQYKNNLLIFYIKFAVTKIIVFHFQLITFILIFLPLVMKKENHFYVMVCKIKLNIFLNQQDYTYIVLKIRNSPHITRSQQVNKY